MTPRDRSALDNKQLPDDSVTPGWYYLLVAGARRAFDISRARSSDFCTVSRLTKFFTLPLRKSGALPRFVLRQSVPPIVPPNVGASAESRPFVLVIRANTDARFVETRRQTRFPLFRGKMEESKRACTQLLTEIADFSVIAVAAIFPPRRHVTSRRPRRGFFSLGFR